MISAIANGGKLFLPQVVEGVENLYGKRLKDYPPVEVGRVQVSEKNLRIVQDALMGAVNESNGTGGSSALKGIRVAGKTGTAQVVKMAQDFKKGDMERMAMRFRDHAWFVAFAPYEEPQIAVAVLVENGGFGAAAAAPIAKKVIGKYLKVDAPPTQTVNEATD